MGQRHSISAVSRAQSTPAQLPSRMSLVAAVAARSRSLLPARCAQPLLCGFPRVPWATSPPARPAAPVRCGGHELPPPVAHARANSGWVVGPSWAAQPSIAPLATAPARAFGTSKGKKKMTFKLAKKLLKIRPEAVPFRKRQKRSILMNYAQYAINYPFESHWTKFVPHRLEAASGALENVYRERFGVEVGGESGGVQRNEDTSPLDLPEPGVAELADAYHSAAGDPDALLKLMQAGHASQSQHAPRA